MELQEKDFELIVSKQELGTLETNALTILDKVKEILPNYKAENYTEETIDLAVKDRALLNNTSKLLNKQRIELEKKFMQPFENFKSIVRETTDLINEASSKIDEIVKDVENKAKAKKRAKIENIFIKYVGELDQILTFEKIFNEKWLNKTYKIELIEKEIEEKISIIRNDLLAIGNLKSKYEIELKNDYLLNFNLSEVINKNNELMKKEELLKSQQEDSTKVVEEKNFENMKKMANTKVEEKVTDKILTYVLKITGKTSQMKALRQFLETNEMTFEKVGDK